MMPVSLQLAIRQWHARPLRPLLCALAIGAAVTLVVCVGAGFDSLRASLQTGIGQMMGVAQVQIRPTQRGVSVRMSPQVLAKVLAHGEVAQATGRMQTSLALKSSSDKRWFEAVGVNAQLDQQLRPKTFLAGKALSGRGDEVLLDESVAQTLGATVGMPLKLSGDSGNEQVVTVVGITKHPQIEILQKPTIYLPTETLLAASGLALGYNVVDVVLKGNPSDAELDKFGDLLGRELGKSVNVMAATTRKARFDQDTKVMTLGLLVVSIIAMASAALIIGTTLSVGVQERIRQFGQLRSIGASRGQLLLFLGVDGLLLMVLGNTLGILMGWGLSWGLVKLYTEWFTTYELSWRCLGMAFGSGMMATLIGAMIPAWQVWQITPMEAVRQSSKAARRGSVLLAALLGLGALGLQAGLWQIRDVDVRFWVYVCAGIPLVFVGYGLLGPGVLLGLQRSGASQLGRLVGVRPALLKNAWSRTPWRAGGMIAALMIGVTMFTTVRLRSEAILQAWQFPSKFPDLFTFSYYPVPNARLTKISTAVPGVTAVSRLSVFPVELGKPIFRIRQMTAENQTMFICVEPEKFREMVDLDFVQGDPQWAWQELAAGQHVFVSKEFYVARGLGVGDKISLKVEGGVIMDFTIAGVVSSNGMDIAKGHFDMRGTFQDAAVSSVVGSFGDAEKLFGLRGSNMLLVNVDHQLPRDDVMNRLRPLIAEVGMGSASSLEMKETLQKVMRRIAVATGGLALLAMLVATLGVANMVVASMNARKYEFGVLRAVGAGRGQLARMVLAEILLVALVAVGLGSLAGIHLAYMSTRLDRMMVGYVTELPLQSTLGPIVGITLGTTVCMVMLATLIPAWRGACAAQRTLLAAGRG